MLALIFTDSDKDLFTFNGPSRWSLDLGREATLDGGVIVLRRSMKWWLSESSFSLKNAASFMGLWFFMDKNQIFIFFSHFFFMIVIKSFLQVYQLYFIAYDSRIENGVKNSEIIEYFKFEKVFFYWDFDFKRIFFWKPKQFDLASLSAASLYKICYPCPHFFWNN